MSPGSKKSGSPRVATDQLGPGDLVLAKLKGFPLWPAKIGRPEEWGRSPDPSKCFVEFFGTSEIAFVAPADVQVFTNESKSKLPARYHGKITEQFSLAVEEICKAFEELHRRGSYFPGNGAMGELSSVMPKGTEFQLSSKKHEVAVFEDSRPSKRSKFMEEDGNIIRASWENDPSLILAKKGGDKVVRVDNSTVLLKAEKCLPSKTKAHSTANHVSGKETPEHISMPPQIALVATSNSTTGTVYEVETNSDFVKDNIGTSGSAKIPAVNVHSKWRTFRLGDDDYEEGKRTPIHTKSSNLLLPKPSNVSVIAERCLLLLGKNIDSSLDMDTVVHVESKRRTFRLDDDNGEEGQRTPVHKKSSHFLLPEPSNVLGGPPVLSGLSSDSLNCSHNQAASRSMPAFAQEKLKDSTKANLQKTCAVENRVNAKFSADQNMNNNPLSIEWSEAAKEGETLTSLVGYTVGGSGPAQHDFITSPGGRSPDGLLGGKIEVSVASSGGRPPGRSSSGNIEISVARDALKGMIETLSRTKGSIGRASRVAIDCAKYGIASEIVELLIRKLESEHSLHHRVALFFLVDSITQCSHRQKGVAWASYIPTVQAALPRLLGAAAPPGAGAYENRRQCLKILRLWLERKIFPESVLRRYMDDIEFQNDFSNAKGFVKYRSRMKRSASDPLLGMEDMIDDEFGSNASCQLPMLLSTNLFEDIEDMSRDVCKAPGNPVLEVATASEDPQNRFVAPHGRRHHILADVDGELEMEDVSPSLKDDGTLPNNFLKKDVKYHNPGRYLESMSNKQSVFPPLPDVPPPPLPIGPPPLTPPLPLDPPPSLPPLPLALLPPVLPRPSLPPPPPPPPPPHLRELPPPPFLSYLPELPTLPSLPSSRPLPLFQQRPYHRLPSLPSPPKYSLLTGQAPLDHFSYVKPLLPQNIQQQPYNSHTSPSLADGWKQRVPDDKWRMHSSARKAGGYLETLSSSQMGYFTATGSSLTTGRSVPFGPSELDLGYSQMSPSGFDVSALNSWRPG